MKRRSTSSSIGEPKMPSSSLLPEADLLPPVPTDLFPVPDVQILPSADEEDRLRAEREKRRKANSKTIHTVTIERHNSDYPERFLKSLGSHASHYDRPPPSQPQPTKKQLKRYYARLAKKRALPKQKKRDTQALGFIPYDFWLLENFKQDVLQYSIVKRCASLAIQDYNISQNTKYRFDDDDEDCVVNVGWFFCTGVMYYIVFEAKNSEGTTTFEAKVLRQKLSRKVAAISVLAVKIKRHADDEKRAPLRWVTGCLRELVG